MITLVIMHGHTCKLFDNTIDNVQNKGKARIFLFSGSRESLPYFSENPNKSSHLYLFV